MGMYLATGIVKEIYIYKGDIDFDVINIEDIIESLGHEINLDRYIFNEDERYISWTIQPEMLEGNLPTFLEKQYEMYENSITPHAKSKDNFNLMIEAVREAKTGDNILELADQKKFPQFQSLEYIMEYIDVKKLNSPFSSSLRINYELISFFLDGKISMECYSNIFRYFEKNIHMQKDKYPIAECVKVKIQG